MTTWPLAHGSLSGPGIALAWPLDPLPLLGSLAAAAAYVAAWRRVNARHPTSRISAWRLASWLGGLGAVLVALDSPIDAFADDLLSVHMIQHLLLTMVAPPLLALGAPVLVLLRVSTPAFRSSVVLPALHARVLRMVASPVLGWVLFTVVMWATHFTPLFEAALEDEQIHVLEHVAFIVTGCLFWWPIVGADPMPKRLRFGPRMVYVLAQMPVMAAIGLIIYFAPGILYPHYALAAPERGISAVVDQQIGGLMMWAVGDVVMLGATALLVTAWMRADARRSERRHPARPPYRT